MTKQLELTGMQKQKRMNMLRNDRSEPEGFGLEGWYSVQWYCEDFIWWYVTVCSVIVRISSGGMLQCAVVL
jgi:hypothetical protein